MKRVFDIALNPDEDGVIVTSELLAQVPNFDGDRAPTWREVPSENGHFAIEVEGTPDELELFQAVIDNQPI